MDRGGGGTGIIFETLSNALFKKSSLEKPATTCGLNQQYLFKRYKF